MYFYILITCYLFLMGISIGGLIESLLQERRNKMGKEFVNKICVGCKQTDCCEYYINMEKLREIVKDIDESKKDCRFTGIITWEE